MSSQEAALTSGKFINCQNSNYLPVESASKTPFPSVGTQESRNSNKLACTCT